MAAVLPVTFDGAARELERLIDEHSPMSSSRPASPADVPIAVERVGSISSTHAFPTTRVLSPSTTPSVPGAPPAHFSSLPVKAIVRDIAGPGIPVALSHSAGTFVSTTCSSSPRSVPHTPGLRAGFVHVPWAGDQAPRPAARASDAQPRTGAPRTTRRRFRSTTSCGRSASPSAPPSTPSPRRPEPRRRAPLRASS